MIYNDTLRSFGPPLDVTLKRVADELEQLRWPSGKPIKS